MVLPICLGLIPTAMIILGLAYMTAAKAQRKVNTVLLRRIEELERALKRNSIEVDPIAETLPAAANIEEPRLAH